MLSVDLNKNFIGKIFFAASILMFCYLLITPLNHLIVHIDEYYSMMLCTIPFSDMINLMNHDVHPPLFYSCLKMIITFLTPLGINTLFVGKLVTIIPYLIILLFSATKLKKEYGWFTAGLFSLSLIIMSEFFRHYLTIRMYSWGMLFLLLTFIYFKDVITEFDKKSWLLFTIFSVLGAYTHYFTVISSFCLYLILLIYIVLLHKTEIKHWIMSVALAVIFYLPWLPSLIHQLTQGSATSYPPLTVESVFISFSYFAYNQDLMLNILVIFIALIIGIIYYKESENISKEDYFYILSGISAYVATILILLGVSVIKPIFMPRYLMPVASIFWLTLSIMVGKINNKKFFAVTLVLIAILCLLGISNVISESETIYSDTSLPQSEIINQITQDNNSIVILTDQNIIMYFLPYSSQWNMYCVHSDVIWGMDINRLHQIFDFNDIYSYELSEFIKNNTDKNIYLITWGEPKVDSDVFTYSLTYDRGVNFSKVFNYNSSIPTGFYGSSEFNLPDGFNVSYVHDNSSTIFNSECSYTVTEHPNETVNSIINDYYQKHKDDTVIKNTTIIDGINVTSLTLEVDGKIIHTNYYFEKEGVTYQIYPYLSENMDQDIFNQIVNSIHKI